MNAVISLAAMSRSTSRTAVWPLYCTSRSRSSKTSSRASSGCSSEAPLRGVVDVGIGAFDAGRHERDVSWSASSVMVMGPSSAGHAALPAGEEGGHEPGEDREDEDDEDQRERRSPGPVLGAGERRVGVAEDLLRERGVRAVEQAPVRLAHDADREEQRRGLARGAGDGEQRTAHDPRGRVREHDRADRARLARRRARSSPRAARAGTSRSISSVVLITIGSIRQASASAPAKPVLLLRAQHHERVDEEAHHDRRHAGHHLGRGSGRCARGAALPPYSLR